MSKQPDLFGDLPLPASASLKQTGIRALKIQPQGSLSAAQQSFNKLLAQVASLTTRIELVRSTTDAHRIQYNQTLDKLYKERDTSMVRMCEWLHQRLQGQGLSKAHKRWASDIIIELSECLATDGHAQMRELHDSYSKQSFAQKREAEVRGAREELEDILGAPLGDVGDAGDYDSLMRAAAKSAQERLAADSEAAAAASATRKPRGTKSKKALQAEQEAGDAQGALRTIFRQLASALHPDRETDPTERLRKTALMSQVNAAYARRDLTSLLQLQLEVASFDPQSIAQMAEQKVRALSRLLKEQVETLGLELFQLQEQARAEFDLMPFEPVTPKVLARGLSEQGQALRQEVRYMGQNLARVKSDDAQFKDWLREQRDAHQSDDGPFLDFAQFLTIIAPPDAPRRSKAKAASAKKKR